MGKVKTRLLKFNFYTLIVFLLSMGACNSPQNSSSGSQESSMNSLIINSPTSYPVEMFNFEPYEINPVFSGTNKETWDQNIRERGFILKENNIYKMWYTGYQSDSDKMALGMATSEDGINWIRNPINPIFNENWTEDMMVIKVNNIYHMFAEGKNDIAHRLESIDGIEWRDQGSLDLRFVDGENKVPGPYGTPTVLYENDIWYLFYERNDEGIWLATSKDLDVWTNIQDDPILSMGPEPYDKYGLAVNQIIKYEGMYYAYYHGTAFEDWREWSTNVAVSEDLLHWEKYSKNPILGQNKSSGILVFDGKQNRLYTMHENVVLHFPKSSE